MKPRLLLPLFIAALLVALGTFVAACGTSTDTDATAAAQAELLLEATATAEALAEGITPSLTATAEAREEAAREDVIATAEARFVEATATAVASIGLTRDNPVPLGEAEVLPEGWEITVVDFTPDATEAVLAEDTFNNTPPDSAFKYVMVRVQATNISAGDPARFDSLNVLTLVGSRDVTYEQGGIGCIYTPDGFFTTVSTVAFSGITLEGTVCFQVGEDESDFIMIADFFFGEGTRVFFAVQ